MCVFINYSGFLVSLVYSPYFRHCVRQWDFQPVDPLPSSLSLSSLTLKWIIRSFPSFHILAQILYQLIITWDVFQTAGLMVANFSVLFQHAFFFVLFWLKNPLWLRKEKIFQSTSSKHSVTDVKNEFNAFKYIRCYRIPVSCNSCTCVHGCTLWHH